MKLLYLSSPAFADSDFPLIRTFQEKGLDVTYVIMLSPNSMRSTLFDIKKIQPENGLVPALSYSELEVYKNYFDMSKTYILNNTSSKVGSLSYLKNAIALYRFIKREKFDVLHLDNDFDRWSLIIYAAGNWIKTFHDPFPHSGDESFRRKKKYIYATWFPKKFVILNYNQKERFCRKYKIKEKDILVNSFGVFDYMKTFMKANIQTEPYNILFFGRISPYKGLDYLCEAMEKVHTVIPEANLTIAGGGKIYFDYKQYEKLPYIKMLNHYIGMHDLAELLQRCAFSVCPYINATQSGVIMTSYSMGKPVLATRVGGLPEMIEEGKTGFLIPPKDTDALANTIIEMLQNNKLLSDMSNYISKEYYCGPKSWSAIADKYIEFYKSSF